METVELYRAPIQEAKFEDLHAFTSDSEQGIYMPSASGEPSIKFIHRTKFSEYCQDLITRWGEGDFVVVFECSARFIKIDNPNYQAEHKRRMQPYIDYYASKPSGGFTGD